MTNNIRLAAPGVWQVVLGWTRAYLLSNGSSFSLVDCGTRWDRVALLTALGELGLRAEACDSVLLTHAHCDHAGNAAYFADRGARLLAHVDEAPFIETRSTYVPPGWRALSLKGFVFAGGELLFPVRRHALDQRLCDGELLETPAGAWRVVHTPGHTVGHVSYFREADGALLSGDALLSVIPFRRIPGLSLAPPLFGVSLTQARQSARRLADLQPRVLMPGHGGVITEDTARRINAFVRRLRGW